MKISFQKLNTFFLTILFILIFTCPSFSQDVSSPGKLMEEGDKFYQQQNYKDALDKYREGLLKTQKVSKEKAEFLEKVAKTHHRMKQLDKAVESYKQAVSIYRRLRNLKKARKILTSISNIYIEKNDYNKSVEYLEEALFFARLTKSSSEIGRAYGNMGNGYYRVGKYKAAITCLRRAIRNFEKIQDITHLEIYTCSLGAVYSSKGEFKEAIKSFEKSLALAKSLKKEKAIGRNLGNLGITYSHLQEYTKSLKYLNEALEIARRLKNKKREMLWLGSMGNVLNRMGKNTKALKYYTDSIKIADEIDDKWSKINYTGNIGIIYLDTGEFRKALINFKKAFEFSKKIGDKRSEVVFLGNIALVYSNLGLHSKSLTYSKKALKLAKEMGDKVSEGTYLGNMGNLYRAVGKPEKAEYYYREALAIALKTGDLKGQGINLGNLGNIYVEYKKYDKAIRYFQEALDIAIKNKNDRDRGIRLGNLANAYRLSGKLEKALEYFDRAIEITTNLENRRNLIPQYYSRGLTYRDMKKLDNAIEDIEKAIKIIEDIRGSLALEEYKSSYSDLHYNIYGTLIELLIERGKSREAFEYSERAKARSFLDVLGNDTILKETAKDKNLAEKELELLSKIRTMERDIYNSDKNPSGILLRKLKKARKEHQVVLEQLKLTDEEYTFLISVNPSSIEEIKKHLNSDEVLVEYYYNNNKIFAWIITKDTFNQVTIPYDPAILNKEVKELRKLLEFSRKSKNKGDYRECRAKLSLFYSRYFLPADKIIDKISQNDSSKIKRLIVIPYGQMHMVPFSACIDSHGKYLVNKYEILTEISASSFVLFRKRKNDSPDKFIGFALGNFQLKAKNTKQSSSSAISRGINEELLSTEIRAGFKPLPGSKKETEEISSAFKEKGIPEESYIEKEFIIKNVLKKAPVSGILHFATHGVQSGKYRGRFSGLLASDGFIYLMDIFKLKLNSSLVVLSACNTSAGEIDYGDNMVSLSQAFLQVGADNLVATLWSIEDEATRELMGEFYREILAGKSIPGALRTAQLKTQKKYPHPVYWAAFVVYGRGN